MGFTIELYLMLDRVSVALNLSGSVSIQPPLMRDPAYGQSSCLQKDFSVGAQTSLSAGGKLKGVLKSFDPSSLDLPALLTSSPDNSRICCQTDPAPLNQDWH